MDLVDLDAECWWLWPCVLWTGALDRDGYGQTWHDSKRAKAHRVAWMETFGPIPDGLFVLHHCDNPPCHEPRHLFLGTAADNAADMVSKGRSAKGTRNGRAVLGPEDIATIRSSTETARALARHFGVSDTAILKIRHRVTWAHI